MPDWTPEQQRAILSSGNTIVSAAAGSGKTTVLTERLVRLVAEKRIPVDRLLVLTFTRAAAGEMQDRIRKAFEKLLNQCEPEEGALPSGDTEQTKQYLYRQIDTLPRAYVSTIDSFCTRVVRRHGHLIGLAPGTRVADEMETEAIRSRALDLLLTGYGKAEDPDWKRLLLAAGSENGAIEMVESLWSFLCSQPEPEQWLERQISRYRDEESLKIYLTEVMTEAQQRIGTAVSALEAAREKTPENWKLCSVVDSELSQARALMVQKSYNAFRAALRGMSFGTLRFPPDVPENEKPYLKAPRDALKELITKKLQKQFFREYEEELLVLLQTGEMLRSLQKAVLDYTEAYQQEKYRTSVMDFNDLEHFTLRLFKEHPEVAAEYREKFLYIAVDEYQDSNGVQDAILNRIRRENNLFLVGDVKQSIYGFRRAEPRLFLKKCSEFSGSAGERIDLQTNFRSDLAVIDCVNEVFRLVMREETAEIAYDPREELHPGPAASGDGFAKLFLLDPALAGKEAQHDTPLSDAEAEARLVAGKIRELLNSGSVPEKNGSRPVRYGDIAILLRAGTDAPAMATVLARAGIPAYVQSTGGYYDAIEVQLALNLLSLIDNRRQDIPLMSLLRSGLLDSIAGVFTTEECAAVALRGKADKLTFSEAFERYAREETDGLSDKCRRVLGYLAGLRREAKLHPLDVFFGMLMDETDLAVRAAAQFGGIRRSANLDALIERAKLYEQNGGSGISGFLRFMKRAKEKNVNTSTTQHVDTDAVRIMTMHHAKGLEFPYVFVCRLNGEFNRQDAKKNLMLHAELGIGLRFLNGDRKTGNSVRTAIRMKNESEQTAEEMRVLYVAMTRAKRGLFLTACCEKAQEKLDKASPDKKATSPLSWLLPGPHEYMGVEVLPFPGEDASPLPSPDVALRAPREEDVTALQEALSWVYPFAEESSLPSKASVTGLSEEEAADIASPLRSPAFLEPAPEVSFATLRGTAVHSVLQAMPPLPQSREQVCALAEQLCSRGLIRKEILPMLPLGSLSRFTQSELWQRLCRSPRCERELPFVRTVPASSLYPEASGDREVLLQGVIDCCFLENGRWILLDYKTDRIPEGSSVALQAATHTAQLALYASALEALTGYPVAERYVVMLSVGEVVPV